MVYIGMCSYNVIIEIGLPGREADKYLLVLHDYRPSVYVTLRGQNENRCGFETRPVGDRMSSPSCVSMSIVKIILYVVKGSFRRPVPNQ